MRLANLAWTRSSAAAILAGVAAAAWLLLGVAAFAASGRLAGGYKGIDEARGMRIEMTGAGDSLSGVFIDVDGVRTPFALELRDGAAEGVIKFARRGPTLVRLTSQSAGLVMVFAPLDAQMRPKENSARSFAFVRKNMALPDPPQLSVPAPRAGERKTNVATFLDNYEFWDPVGAGRGYAGLQPKYRTLIRLFPLVQTDVIWKLCQDPDETEGVSEALRGQGVTCAEVLAVIEQAQRTDAFTRFKNDVAVQRGTLRLAVSCAQGLAAAKLCQRISVATSQAALSMDTALSILRKYR